MKVLVLSHMYPKSTDSMDGIFVHHQVRHLIRAGCQVVVISPVPYVPSFLVTNERRKGYKQAPPVSSVDGVEVRVPRFLRPPGGLFHPLSAYSMYHGLKRRLKEMMSSFGPDILHAYTATPDGYASLLIKKAFDLPLVVSLLGSDINVYPYRDRWTYHLTNRVIAEADRLVAVSLALKSAAEQLASSRRDIAVVYMGCDLERFRYDPNARRCLRDKFAIAQDSPVICFVGRLLRAKGVYELLEAVVQLRKMHTNLYALFVGAGEEYNGLYAAIGKGNLQRSVRLVGRRPHSEIPQWLSACDVFVLPSWREGLPNVVLEAMACRRPVVATRVGGIPEAVEHGESGILVDKGDVRALTHAIAELIADPSKREKMGQAGRRAVEERFTWEKNAEKTIALYEEVLRDR